MKSYAEKLPHQKDIQFTVSRVHEKRWRKAQPILDHIFGSKKCWMWMKPSCHVSTRNGDFPDVTGGGKLYPDSMVSRTNSSFDLCAIPPAARAKVLALLLRKC